MPPQAEPPVRAPLGASLRRMWALLTASERRSATTLLGFMVVGVVLDALGVGLVLPVIALLTRDEQGAWFARVREWAAPMGELDREGAIVLAMVALVTVFTVKGAYRWWLASRLSRFAYEVQLELSRRLFEVFLRRPWSFHLQRNSATLVQTVAHEVDQFAFGVVLPALGLVAESMVLLALAVLIVAFEPVGGLVALVVLATSAAVFHRLTTARATALGTERRLRDRARFRQVQQGLGAVKELKVLGRESTFVERFERATRASGEVGRRVLTVRELPRITVEIVAVAGLSALVIAMVLTGRPIASIVPVIGLFVVAILRIVPSVARILGSVQSIGLGAASIDALRSEFADAGEPTDSEPPPTRGSAPALALADVRFAYPNAAPVLDGITLAIAHGEMVGILGPSGSGKSTLVDLLLGLHAPDAGALLVDGADARPRLRWWQSSIGYVPQTIFLTDDSVRRNIAFGVRDADIDPARLDRAIHAAQLAEFIASLPQGIETIVGERGVRISGGQRQRIGIARALYHDPRVLVLDEATSALDEATESGVMEAIHALQGTRTIIIVAHRLGTLARCDRLFRIERGRIEELERSQLRA